MARGTSLFGWCLPDMPISQHEKCFYKTGSDDAPRICPCECHIDFDKFKKQKQQVTKKTKGKK